MREVVLALTFVFVLTACVAGQTARAIENRLLGHLANIDKWSNYGSNPDEGALDRANDLLRKDLLRYGRQAATLSYAFPRLKGKMHVTTSSDGRFRIYSWDQGSGGTMHEFDSVFQFKGRNDRVYASTVPAGGFFHDIFQVSGNTGTIYLAVSTFIASGSLLEETIKAFRMGGSMIESDAKLIRTTSGLQNSISFEYDFSSVMERAERPVKLFKFHETQRSFSFPVVIQDDETPQGRVTEKRITYRFDGRHFVKMG